jgi:hypothetical protein
MKILAEYEEGFDEVNAKKKKKWVEFYFSSLFVSCMQDLESRNVLDIPENL